MSDERSAHAGRRGTRRYGWMLVLAVMVLLADQASKVWAISALAEGEPVSVVPGVIRLRLLFNPGAAFSIGEGATWVFTLVAAAAAAGIAYVGRRLRSAAWTVALGGLLGGAASHLLDRLFRPPGFARGHVVDFIDYGGLFVGNLADIALTGSCAFVILLSARGVSLDGTPDSGLGAPTSSGSSSARA
ncbi:signal peptidase II [Planomonospora sp. ID82291]|uniref:signal peptidase II n=1 Tax=Planomonospora sp. ID82291 TaxID=2738136 RepID=UPI0018C3F8CF|nr:signal peptidase II [Planomonospora sp. ID82291]MBG0816602.1 signal peptidase II [Planomonospora sp. ID82291]